MEDFIIKPRVQKSRKIGSKFTTSVGTFQVVEAHNMCNGCFLYRDTKDPLNRCKHTQLSRKLTGPCKAPARKDGKYVIFIKVD